MKFALRDDDLNYFYNPAEIEKNYTGIWEICPVSMSVIPFIKGNWPKNVKDAEKRGPGYINEEILGMLKSDNKVYPIGDNLSLVQFIKEKITENKIHLTLHGIHHRNEDEVIPQFSGNFGFGAEFYTSRDLSLQLKEAKRYLERLFDQQISVFTPPQNLYSVKGLDAITNNMLSICCDLPNLKSLKSIKLIGFNNYIRYFLFKIFNREFQFPHPIINGNLKMISHYRLQPGTDITKLYSDFDSIRKIDGVFVISTHSYGFNYKMRKSPENMGEVLKKFIKYASSFKNVEFVKLNQIFE